MGREFQGKATAAINFGQHVLIRGGVCGPADPKVANGIARPLPAFYGQARYKKGDWVVADRIEGVGARDVHALAGLPLMDPIKLNLPAGKLTEAEYQARLDLQFAEAGLDRAASIPPTPTGATRGAS